MRAELDHPTLRPAKSTIEPKIAWLHVPRLEPGEYSAYCRSAKIYRDRVFKRWVCAVQFDVMDENLNKLARLTWFMNLGTGDKPQVTRRRNYWTAWVRANGGPPQRRDRMSARVFTKRYATVVVDDTTRDSRKELAATELAYSVIHGVVGWNTGAREQRGAESLTRRWIEKERIRMVRAQSDASAEGSEGNQED